MSEDEEKASKARILLDHADTEKALNLRRAEAHQWGRYLSQVGMAVSDYPDSFFTEGWEAPSGFSHYSAPNLDAARFNLDRLQDLLKEIADLRGKLRMLSEQKKGIGY